MHLTVTRLGRGRRSLWELYSCGVGSGPDLSGPPTQRPNPSRWGSGWAGPTSLDFLSHRHVGPTQPVGADGGGGCASPLEARRPRATCREQASAGTVRRAGRRLAGLRLPKPPPPGGGCCPPWPGPRGSSGSACPARRGGGQRWAGSARPPAPPAGPPAGAPGLPPARAKPRRPGQGGKGAELFTGRTKRPNAHKM